MLIYIWLLWMFLVGTAIGSFLNVLIYRLPRGLGVSSPPSHCPQCGQRVRWYDNLPVLSYALLRGKCRRCRASIPSSYLAIEVLTGCAFAGIFALDVMFNWHQNIQIGGDIIQIYVWRGAVSISMWLMVFTHGGLFCLGMVGLMCERQGFPVPLRISAAGLLLALVASLYAAWPAPASPLDLKSDQMVRRSRGLPTEGVPTLGQQSWPVWYPLPEYLPPGSMALGVTTVIAGAATGFALGMVIAWVFRQVPFGLHGAFFLAAVGGFLGWQPVTGVVVLASLAWCTAPARGFPVATLTIAAGLVWLSWWWVGPHLEWIVHSVHGLVMTAAVLMVLLSMNALLERRGARRPGHSPKAATPADLSDPEPFTQGPPPEEQ